MEYGGSLSQRCAVIERVSDYADGSLVYLGSPPSPVGLAGAAQQQ